jgi:hypothetical protein
MIGKGSEVPRSDVDRSIAYSLPPFVGFGCVRPLRLRKIEAIREPERVSQTPMTSTDFLKRLCDADSGEGGQ